MTLMRLVASVFKKFTDVIKMKDTENEVDDRFKIQENFKRLRKSYILQNICQILHLDKKNPTK